MAYYRDLSAPLCFYQYLIFPISASTPLQICPSAFFSYGFVLLISIFLSTCIWHVWHITTLSVHLRVVIMHSLFIFSSFHLVCFCLVSISKLHKWPACKFVAKQDQGVWGKEQVFLPCSNHWSNPPPKVYLSVWLQILEPNSLLAFP